MCEGEFMLTPTATTGSWTFAEVGCHTPSQNPLPRTHASRMFDVSSLVMPHVDKDTLYPTSCRTHVV
jgi:hypothetical protein